MIIYNPTAAFRYAPLFALAAALAWKYRKDKFILFGATCMVFTFGAMLVQSRSPEWIFNSFIVASGFAAAVSIGFGLRDLVRLFAKKRSGPRKES